MILVRVQLCTGVLVSQQVSGLNGTILVAQLSNSAILEVRNGFHRCFFTDPFLHAGR